MAFLSDKNVGDIVKIRENGEPVKYIIVHKGLPSDMYDESCDGVWLLRQQANLSKFWNVDSNNDYENTDIEMWLNGTFLNTIDEKIRAAIKTVKIPYKKGAGDAATGIQSGSNGLSCRVFFLGGYEVGFTQADNKRIPIDGAKLSHFSDNASRACNDSSGSATRWWLRSPDTSNTGYAWTVDLSGTYIGDLTANNVTKVRPAFILPYSLVVDSEMG